jgi:hypothetical protein
LAPDAPDPGHELCSFVVGHEIHIYTIPWYSILRHKLDGSLALFLVEPRKVLASSAATAYRVQRRMLDKSQLGESGCPEGTARKQENCVECGVPESGTGCSPRG